MEYRTDVLVIGSGIAGLYFAINASKYCDVTIITKKDRAESNTNYAQGGIATVWSENDNFESHIKDTLIAGDGLCNREAVEFIVRDGPSEIKSLIELGINFSRNENGTLHLAKEGGHSQNRIVHAKDLTGREIEHSLLACISNIPNIKLFEDYFAIDLITEHNLAHPPFDSLSKRNCFGAFAFDIKAQSVHKFISKMTVLATGGLGQVYLHTTNPSIATGDGFAIAYRAGAVIANMEFIQFHPTSLYEPEKPNKNSTRSFLISEAVRGFGAKLRLRTGEEFMNKYDSRAELAPRDIVARAIDNELKRTGDSFVYLDITHKSKHQLQENFPHIFNKCLEIGLDISKDFIPVVPAAHYACGGIVTNLSGQTTIENLYAIGEVAMTGVHGANRLASNSLLEALVFAKAAAEETKNLSKKSHHSLINDIPEWDESGTSFAEEKVLISQNRKEIREVLWDYVGIVRSNERLNRARKRCDIIYEETAELYRKSKISEEILELRNLCEVASLIITSASKRKESRGLHYNIDYLYKDDINWLKPTYLQNLKI